MTLFERSQNSRVNFSRLASNGSMPDNISIAVMGVEKAGLVKSLRVLFWILLTFGRLIWLA